MSGGSMTQALRIFGSGCAGQKSIALDVRKDKIKYGILWNA